MSEFVYQVRVYGGYGEHFIEYGGEWEFENVKDAMSVFTIKYAEYEGEYMRITKTPKYDEDECDELGIEYEVETIMEINVEMKDLE